MGALNAFARAYLNANLATSTRCVGATENSIDNTTSTLQYKSTYSTDISDSTWSSDLVNMAISGTYAPTSSTEYWFASRYLRNYVNCSKFNVTYASNSNKYGLLYEIDNENETYPYSICKGVRPVITLKNNLEIKSGTGEADSPYVLGI